MSSNTITFKGIDKVTKNFLITKDRVRKAVKFALEEAGGDLLKESIKIVPHDVGTLQNSGNVSSVEEIGTNQMQISVGYNTPYAVRVHEHPEYKFQKGRKGKYLENPLKQNAKKYEEGIAKRIKQSLTGSL